jgi:hypothetical protein
MHIYNLKGGLITMKNAVLYIYRCIVGPECGFTGEGNEQWYYSLAIVINLMLVWWLKPEVALLFTILVVIHYLTVFAYGLFDLEFGSVIFSYAYLGIHLTLLVIAAFSSFKWAVITALITIVALFLAPDCTGENFFICRQYKFYNALDLLFNTIIFIVFVRIDFLLPINLWIKLAIIAGALVIHPVIDYLQGECVIITDTIFDALGKIARS